MRSGGMVVLAFVFAAVGAIFGATDVATVAFAGEQGHPELAGVVLEVFALGSMIAGLLYGARHWTAPLWRWGRPATFGGLDDLDRERIWEDLLKVSIFETRQLVYLLKMSFCMVVLGDESVLEHIGAYEYSTPARPTVPASALRPRALDEARGEPASTAGGDAA